jgi:hypothetical protein
MPITDFTEYTPVYEVGDRYYPSGFTTFNTWDEDNPSIIRQYIFSTAGNLSMVNNTGFTLESTDGTPNEPLWTGGGTFTDCDIVQRIYHGANTGSSSTTRVVAMTGRGKQYASLLRSGSGISVNEAIKVYFYPNRIRINLLIHAGNLYGAALNRNVLDIPNPAFLRIERRVSVWTRVRISGVYPNYTIKARIWKPNQAEPNDWQATYTTTAADLQLNSGFSWDPETQSPPFSTGGSALTAPILSISSVGVDVLGIGAHDLDISAYENGLITGKVRGYPSGEPLDPSLGLTVDSRGGTLDWECLAPVDESGNFAMSAPPGIRRLSVALPYNIHYTAGYVPWGNDIEVEHTSEGTVGVNYHVKEVTEDITTPLELHEMRYKRGGTFRLMNDIDMTGFMAPEYENYPGVSWLPSWDLYGSFDGQGFTIKNFKIFHPESYGGDPGAFLRSLVGTIENVHFANVDWKGSDPCGMVSYNDGTIRDCSVQGIIHDMSARSNSRINFGCIAAYNYWGATIERCYAMTDISASPDWSESTVGGIAGYNDGTIRNCYHMGILFGDVVGGIVGSNDEGTIVNCYHVGNQRVVGANTYREAVFTNSYYNIDTSGLPEELDEFGITLGFARTTEEMTYPYDEETTYLGWSFPDPWKIHPDTNSGYPQFLIHLVEMSGAVAGTSDLWGPLCGFFALRGRIDAVSRWQAFRFLMEIWAKRNGTYEPVTPFVKVDGTYRPVTEVARKTEDGWEV